MSLQPQVGYPIPEQTARIAKAAFPHGNIYLHMAEALGIFYQDTDFVDLFPTRGQSALSPARLALVTIMQFAEGFSDRQAAEAVRSRIDWKYALGLELTDAGFDHTVLSEFRTRLVAGGAESLLLDKLLTKLREMKLLKAATRQRTNSTHVLAAARKLNRLERVGETLRQALNSLALVAPEWLRAQAPDEWYQRYARRVENYHLPKTDTARNALGATIGEDGQTLLRAVDEAQELAWLRDIPALKTLRQVWAEQYVAGDHGIQFREVKDMPSPAELIASPYDPEARYSVKREVEWIGYKVHFTETCESEMPRLVVNVETTPATTPDDNMLEVIHQSLKQRELLPSQHLVDKGYTDAETLVDSVRQYGVTVIGPVAADPSWQARAQTGFAKAHFKVDWESHVVTCPAGQQSRSWLPNTYPQNGVAWEARFAKKDCQPCQFREQCTRAKVEPRLIWLQKREHHEALHLARARQTTTEFKQQYAARAGIEATHGQAMRRRGLRQSRYLGKAKTHLQHVITAVALNVVRVSEWVAGTPLAKTRVSPFAALRKQRIVPA